MAEFYQDATGYTEAVVSAAEQAVKDNTLHQQCFYLDVNGTYHYNGEGPSVKKIKKRP